MKRPVQVGLAVAFAILLITSMPAAAINTSVVPGGTHTDDTDFQNATLTNMSVSGSGTSASAVASTGGSDIDLTGTNVTGASETFQLGDFDSVSSGPAIQTTGVLNTENDSKTWAGINNTIVDPEASGSYLTRQKAVITGVSEGLKNTSLSTYYHSPGDTNGDGGDEVVLVDLSTDDLLIHDPQDDTTTNTGQTANDVTSGDYDGDGVAEVGFEDSSSNLIIYDVQDDTTTDTGHDVSNIATGDYDGDGVAEIALQEYSSNALKIYDVQDDTTTNSGKNTQFQISSGDVNDDGADEVLFEEESTDALLIYDLQGDSTTDTGISIGQVSAGDTDNDGVAEVVAGDSSTGEIKIYDAQDSTTDNTGETQVYGLTSGDYDDDGAAEVGYRNDTDDVLKIYDPLDSATTDTGDIVASVNTGDFDADNVAEVSFRELGNNVVHIIRFGQSSSGSLDVGDDGTSDVSFTVNSGESKQYDISGLSIGDNVDVSSDNNIDLNISFTENTETENPGVELNGDSQTYSGTLDDGESTTISWPDSALTKNGENTVNVSLPDLSADAPPMTVDYHFETTTTSAWATSEYISPTYDLANVTKMQADINISNATGDFYLEKYDGSSWTTVASTSVTTNGTHTLDPARITDSNSVRARITFDKTDTDPYAEIKSDTAFFLAHSSTADDREPPNNSEQNNEDVTVTANISDYEFTDPQGDNVTAEIYWQGSLAKTVDSITNDQQISYTATDLADGTYNWHIETTDDYGVTESSSTYSVTVNHYAAEVSNMAPNNTSTNAENVDLSFDLTDRDFAEDSGDSVDATLYVDGTQENTWTGLTSNQTLSHTVNGMSDGDHSWYVETTDEYGLTSTSSTAEFTVNHYAPDIDENSATPTGGLSQPDQTYEIDINDTDFAETSGDTVTAELYVDGSKVGEDTLTNNGTVSVDHTVSLGGDHSYYWVATDEYGLQSTSQTFTVSTPDELQIYNESNPDQLLSNVTVDLRFYSNETGEETIVSRSTSNGKINLTGLPVDEPITVVSKAENYTDRRIFIRSVFEQQKLFLLPESVTKVTTIFTLEDYTGDFPTANSALIVQRSLNDSYQTVLGDVFGATGQFSAKTEYEIRHRMILVNFETGDSRMLGTFTPITDSTQTLAVTPPDEDIDVSGVKATISPQTGRIPGTTDTLIEATAIGQNQDVDSWNVVAELRNDTHTVEIWNYSSSSGGTKNTTLDLSGQSGKNLTVTLNYQAGGKIVSEQRVYQIDEHYNPDATFLGALASLIGLSPDSAQSGLTTLLAMFISIFMIGSAARIQPSGELAGLVGVAMLTGFAAIGWVGWGLVFVSGVGLVSFAGLRRGI